MTTNRVKETKQLLRKLRNHQIALANLELLDTIAIFVMDQNRSLGAPTGVRTFENEQGTVVKISVEFSCGTSSEPLDIQESGPDQKLYRKFRKQKAVNVIYLDKDAEVFRIAGGSSTFSVDKGLS